MPQKSPPANRLAHGTVTFAVPTDTGGVGKTVCFQCAGPRGVYAVELRDGINDPLPRSFGCRFIAPSGSSLQLVTLRLRLGAPKMGG